MISRETLVMPDGAEWKTYFINRGCVVFTSKGRELLRDEPDMLIKLRNYRRLFMGRSALSGVESGRAFFASGANSDVFSLDEKRVIKETGPGTSLFFTLERLDKIVEVVDRRTPRWIDVPDHYALLTSGNLTKQFMLMQKIDAGITVEDVLGIDEATPDERAFVERQFGPIDISRQRAVQESFDAAAILMGDAFVAEGLDPADYMTDYHPGNVLIEPLSTPIAGNNYKLWVIDQ